MPDRTPGSPKRRPRDPQRVYTTLQSIPSRLAAPVRDPSLHLRTPRLPFHAARTPASGPPALVRTSTDAPVSGPGSFAVLDKPPTDPAPALRAAENGSVVSRRTHSRKCERPRVRAPRHQETQIPASNLAGALPRPSRPPERVARCLCGRLEAEQRARVPLGEPPLLPPPTASPQRSVVFMLQENLNALQISRQRLTRPSPAGCPHLEAHAPGSAEQRPSPRNGPARRSCLQGGVRSWLLEI